MSILKVDENDFFWQYYRKFYELENREVPHPVNLCNFFWKAVGGCWKSLFKEMSLWFTWLAALILGGACIFGLSRVFSVPPQHLGLDVIYALMCFAGMLIALIAPWVITGSRLKGLASTIYHGTFVVLVVGSMLIIIGNIIVHWHEFTCTWAEFWRGLGILGVGVLCCFGIFIAIAAAAWGLLMICRPIAGWRFTQTVWSYIMAAKHQMCPLIEPPKSFTTK